MVMFQTNVVKHRELLSSKLVLRLVDGYLIYFISDASWQTATVLDLCQNSIKYQPNRADRTFEINKMVDALNYLTPYP